MKAEDIREKIWEGNLQYALTLSALGISDKDIAQKIGLKEKDVTNRLKNRIDTLQKREQISEALVEGLKPLYVFCGQKSMQTLIDLIENTEKEHIKLQAASKLGDWTMKMVLAQGAMERIHGNIQPTAVTFSISERADAAVVRALQEQRTG